MMLNKLSLNTIGLNRIGLNRIGKPSRGSSGRPYIDPEVLSALKAVCICYGKSNDDPDRAIVKNLVDPDNPFVISNAAYKLNSGYGKYEVDFTTWSKRNVVTSNNDNSFSFESKVSSSLLYYSTTIGVDTPSFKIKANISNCLVYYYYINDKGTLSSISILESGEFELPISHNTLYNGNIGIGFEIGRINGTGTGTITQIPSYQGAFVTDGVDDLITSTKTVQEMGITDEVTVVSMIHQIALNPTYNVGATNYLENLDNGKHIRSDVYYAGKTGIYGYTASLINNTASDIKNILGDKADYSTQKNEPSQTLHNSKFSVVGRARNFTEPSSVAWYWTVIANKVLTTDQINQVIAYYNLDRCVEPTVLYDVKRQGLSNDTPDSDWYLKDFSKNGFDMSLFNFAKKGNSGIGKYEVDFTSWKKAHFTDEVNTSSSKIEITGTLTTNSILINTSSTPMYNVEIHSPNKSIVIYFQYDDGTGIKRISLVEGINELPSANESLFVTSDRLNSKGITITQIPSHAGALCFDGVNDFGKVTGLPIYKDYTVVADYERIDIGNIEGIGTSPVLSKSYTNGQGSFIMNFIASTGNSIRSYSFGTENTSNFSDLARQIFYQSKYKSQGFDITAGTGIDGDSLWLGTTRDNDSRFFNGAIYSLMSFPYSLSEFLIERQLKKHKLGTLYPDMVEWRPIYTSNVNDYTITKATYFGETGQHDLVLGNHCPIGTSFRIYVKPSGAVDEVTSVKVDGVELTYDYIDSNYGYAFNDTLSSKSPQKIDITIDEYIRYEDIVQPYPVLLRFNDESGKEVSWGGKFKVGSTITRIGSFYNNNILEGLYTVTNPRLNGVPLAGENHTVEKQMVFTCDATYIKGSNAPKCILSPSRLRIPNSSYKILGYIPDISGHGNHGKINNSAYAEGSGVNADGSYQLDGVDDFITIPTTVGGKQMLMKVIWDDVIADAILYDQRGYPNEFAVYNADNDNSGNPVTAYQARNNGKTYIDGILNSNIKASELKNVNHIITITNELSSGANGTFPIIGSNRVNDAYFTKMALYDFMLFDEISTDEEILTLNEYIGIEPKSKEGLLQPSITVNGSYVVLNTVEDTNDYLVNGTANCGIGFSDESASEQFSTGVTYDKNFSYSIIVIANNNKELISLSHNGVSADSIQSMDYSETTKLYICSTTNGMFAVGSAPQEIIIELSD